MTTRRNILKGGAGLAAILASGKAPAYIVKSIVAARNSIGIKSGGAKVPYDAEVEYLESTGTEYIDLGFYGSDRTSFDLRFYRPSDDVVFFFGATASWGINTLLLLTGHSWMYWMRGASTGSTYVTRSNNLVGMIHILTSGASLTAYNETTEATYRSTSSGTTPFTTGGTICLFGYNSNGIYDPVGAGIRIYSAIIDNGDNRVDLVPVRSKGIGYMYDRVSGHLFGNQGTGAFLYGNDK